MGCHSAAAAAADRALYMVCPKSNENYFFFAQRRMARKGK